MKCKASFLVMVYLAGAVLVIVESDRGKDDDDDDDHDSDNYDDDGQPNYCPEDNGMFPNPTDCASFYNCVDGEAILQTCAPGLLFDPKKKICNFPNRVKCSNECRGPNGLFPSQHRCDEFILCTNNKPKVQKCKKGLWFDSNLQVCNYKDQVLCSLPGSKKKGNKTTTSKPSKKPKKKNYDDDDDDNDYDEPKPKKGRVKVGQYVQGGNLFTIHGSSMKKGHIDLAAASIRSVCPKSRGLFAHVEDCSMFYQCYDGEVLMKACPVGLLFDEHRHMCAYGREVNCEFVPTKQCPKRNGIFPNQSNCTSFYLCTDGVHHKQECPGGLHYDRKRVKCNFPKKAKCKATAKPKPKKSKHCPKMDGIFENPSNCSTFYFCVGGTAYLQECPQGLVFDTRAVKCNFPKIVGCKPPPGILRVLRCPEDDGIFRHPTECGTFFLCRKGRSYQYNCPEGLIFDYNLKRCEYSRDVKCPEHYLERRKHIKNYMKTIQINIYDYVT